MSEQYWVFANGEMKFITWEGGEYDGICDYIEKSFPEIGMDYEFGELNSFKDYRITPKIQCENDNEEKEQKLELIDGELVPVEEPMEVREIMIVKTDNYGDIAKLQVGKIYFHNEETDDIYDPTEEGSCSSVIYKFKNLKYIKDTEWLGETYPLYTIKKRKFKVRSK
tara:strand:+ start:185 stop:685 length:501 start_codon:yes stop_codon:yes gene_type:complete